ncbi:hypothetical protein [Gordonia sp. 852002-50395_SCH5434458]|uniref:hypothetical protein n=1 Tax=Gordonia sp. 852002-50395_SCH5434458 TaxID=1834090 RepID=UPI0007E970EA|nr:hypothetical protein [Gordonia sp. 852002-50395_SCH5434458]OBC01727.1 hypothetical protein A5785_17160 [Gordonia sp. 852002-50395_SCH5434458]
MAGDESGKRSAASMSWDNYGSDGAANNQQSRRRIAREAQRKTAGSDAVAYYARKNPAINTAKTHLNIDMVNDGAGGFRPTRHIEEVVAYGDRRVAHLKPGLKDGNRYMVTTVFHCPWAYLEPDGTHYQAVDRDGAPKVYASGPRKGEPILEPRYRVKPGCEEIVDRYFEDCLARTAQLLPGGQAAIHGYSRNRDETRDHLQIESDPYAEAPSKKDPDALRNGYSLTFGRHPKDAMVPKLGNDGQPILDADGKQRMVREGPSAKMERYHAEFREYMVARGYAVDPERDEQRHDRHLGLQDYKDLEHSRTEVAETEQTLRVEAAMIDEAAIEAHQQAYEAGIADVAVVAAEIDTAAVARSAALDQREAAVRERMASVDALVEEARERAAETVADAENDAIGIVAGAQAEVDQLVADARERAAGIVTAAEEEAGTIRSRATADATSTRAAATKEANKTRSDAAGVLLAAQAQAKTAREEKDESERIKANAAKAAQRRSAEVDAAILDAVVHLEAVRNEARGLDADPDRIREKHTRYPLKEGEGVRKIRTYTDEIRERADRRLTEARDLLNDIEQVHEQAYDPERANQDMTAAKLDTMRALKGPKRADGTARTVDEWVDEKTAERYVRARQSVPTETLRERLERGETAERTSAATLGKIQDLIAGQNKGEDAGYEGLGQ